MFLSEMGYLELVQRLFEKWHFLLWTPYHCNHDYIYTATDITTVTGLAMIPLLPRARRGGRLPRTVATNTARSFVEEEYGRHASGSSTGSGSGSSWGQDVLQWCQFDCHQEVFLVSALVFFIWTKLCASMSWVEGPIWVTIFFQTTSNQNVL